MMAEREAHERMREEKEKIQKDRKKKMIELAENAKKYAKKSDMEVANESRNVMLRKGASDLRDQDNDVVKLLKTFASRATAFTGRDAQLHDREEREKNEEEYERRMDTIMEIDRLRDIERREREESEKRSKRFEDRKVITEQIEERQRMRLIAAEAREQDNQAMKNLMKKYEDDDLRKAEQKKIEMAKSRQETMAMNEQAIARKRHAKEAVRKEMEDILVWQAMRDAELLKKEEEEAAVDQMKRDRQKKLLSQQEKALNRAGEMDELRSRRAFEEAERRARKRERDDYMKNKNSVAELLESRARQAKDKKERDESMKIYQEEEYRNALKVMAKGAERQDKEDKAKVASNHQHRILLNKQIQDDENRRLGYNHFKKIVFSINGTQTHPLL
jgi:Trichohyalin-plectin-homology domain